MADFLGIIGDGSALIGTADARNSTGILAPPVAAKTRKGLEVVPPQLRIDMRPRRRRVDPQQPAVMV